MKVVFAVPNYNMRDNLVKLLELLSAEENDGIFLLDDASADGSVIYVEELFPDVTVVRGEHNEGAGANRNRILPFVSDDDLILFLDADLELRSTGLAEAVRGWFDNPRLGLAGGLILDPSGDPYIWNYGYLMDPRRDVRTVIYRLLEQASPPGEPLRELVRRMAEAFQDTFEFEIKTGKPVRREVEWVSEGLFAIRADLFRRLGGFDPEFRYHTGQDLGARIAEAGMEIWFEPGITARHLEIDVRGENRRRDVLQGARLYYQKHWDMSDETFHRLFG